MVQKDGLLWMAGMYLAGKDAKSPLAAPLHADLKGLPPILVQVGTAETLLDDATRIAEKLHMRGRRRQALDLAEHAARLSVLRPDSLGGPRRLRRDRQLHPQQDGSEYPMPRMTGGEAIVDSLLRHGIDTVFGLPGVQIYGLFDAFARAPTACA